MKIVALGGSLRPHSYTYFALELALKKTEQYENVQTELIDLRRLNLPFCRGEIEYSEYPDVQILRDKMQSASGILLGTPEYHGSISGVLKNALDLLPQELIAGKVIGLIAVVGGIHSTNALNAMHLICRQLQGWVLPKQVVIPYAADSFTIKGELKDVKIQKRLDELVESMVSTVRKLC